MLLTLDSSAIVAALLRAEPYHTECQRLFQHLHSGQHVAVEPYAVLVEVAAAVHRRTGCQRLARRAQERLEALETLRFVELDAIRAAAAIEVATRTGLRGMDSMVVQVSREFGSALVSLDLEMVERARLIVTIQPISAF